MTKPKNRFYAWALFDGRQGIVESWNECLALIKNQPNAKYKMFTARHQAQAWLDAGASYETKNFYGADGVYFDSGTGGIGRVRIRVTDKNGVDLISNVEVSPIATNNYGELLACKYALEYALSSGIKNIFGDSELVIKYWSRGRIKLDEPLTVSLAHEVKILREEFENLGGKIERIPGALNPADIGFHR